MQQELFSETVFFDKEGDTKECSKCKKVLPTNAFSSCHGGTYLRPECKKCMRDMAKSREEIRKIHGMPNEKTYICPICLGTAEEVGDVQALINLLTEKGLIDLNIANDKRIAREHKLRGQDESR